MVSQRGLGEQRMAYTGPEVVGVRRIRHCLCRPQRNLCAGCALDPGGAHRDTPGYTWACTGTPMTRAHTRNIEDNTLCIKGTLEILAFNAFGARKVVW